MFGQILAGFVAGGVMALGLGGSAAAATATIEKPMFNGNRLDWCLNWKADCGKPVADAFCQARGFGRAISYAKAPDIGSRSPTRLLGTSAVCDLAGCDGFRQITCLKQPTLAAKPVPGAGTAAPAVTAAPITRTEKLAAFARTAVYGPEVAPHAAGVPEPRTAPSPRRRRPPPRRSRM